MRISKKVIAIALSVLMAFSMMPFTVFASGAPTATVTEITDDATLNEKKLDAAYKFVANPGADAAYDDYYVTYAVSFDKSVTASDIELWGKIGDDGAWQNLSDYVDGGFTATAGETYYLTDIFGWNPTYAEIFSDFNPFYCGIKNKSAEAVTIDVKLIMAETVEDRADETKVIEVEDTTATAPAKVVPTATVTPISGTDLDAAYKFVANGDGDAMYDNYYVTYAVKFDTDVTADDVELWGKIGDDGAWQNLSDFVAGGFTATAGETYYLTDIFEWNPTFAEIKSDFNPFYCGIKNKSNKNVTIDVKLIMAETVADRADESKVIEVKDTEYTAPAKGAPTATVTPVEGTDLDAAYKYVANDDGDASFDNYYMTYAVKFNRDVTSDDVELWGKIGDDGEWINLSDAVAGGFTANANETYYLTDLFDWNPTYAEIKAGFNPFYCGIKNKSGEDVTIDVKLIMAETVADRADETKLIEIKDTEYTAPAKIAPTATVTEVTSDTAINTEKLDAAYKFVANPGADAMYDGYYVTYAVKFAQDVTADDVELWGKIGDDGAWQNLSDFVAGGFTATAGETYYLTDIFEWNPTYSEIFSDFNPFYCGIKNKSDKEVTIDVKLIMAETVADRADETKVIEVEDTKATIPAVNDEYSITVADEIDLNIYVAATDDVAELKVTNFDLESESSEHATISYKGSDLAALLAGSRYKVRVPLAPAQICDRITVEILDDAGASVRPAITKSIAEYCTELIGNDAVDAKVKSLAQSVLTYGKAASAYFNDYNADLFEAYTIPEAIAEFGDDIARGSISGSDFAISEVSYRATSVPELRFVVTGIEEADAAALTASSSIGNASFAKLADGTIILQVTGIPAARLGEEITITAGDVTIKYTPLRWAKIASTNSNAKFAQLAAAIGGYNKAAKAYFG